MRKKKLFLRVMLWLAMLCMIINLTSPAKLLFDSPSAYAATTPRSENFDSIQTGTATPSPQVINDWTFSMVSIVGGTPRTQVKMLSPNTTNDLYFVGTFAAAANEYGRIQSNTGAFGLVSFKVIERNSSADNYRVVGYLGGIPVVGAEKSFSSPPASFYTVDLTNDTAWKNIDEFRIYADTTIKLEIDDLFVTDPIVADSTAPTAGNSGSITSTNVNASSVTLNWTRAMDDVTPQYDLEYRVYQSSSSNIDTVGNIEKNGTPLGNGFSKNIDSFDVIGLETNATYYFNVIVNDVVGNKSAYTMQQVKTLKTASAPNVTSTTTEEDTISASGLVITPDSQDIADVTYYKISEITGGRLYKNDGTTEISNGDFITKAEGEAGLKFSPNSDANTPAGDSFSFKVQAALDATGTGLSTTATASITVTEVNDDAIASSDTLPSVDENSQPIRILAADLLSNDSPGPKESGQTLMITSVYNGVGGSVVLEGTNVIFTPHPGYRGPASFTYMVHDNGTTNGVLDLKTSVGDVNFTIEPRADKPTVTDAETLEDVQTTSGLVITPTAAGGATTTHYKITGITGGRLFNSSGFEIINEHFITVAEGGAGLKFLPAENQHGQTGFGFMIQAAPDTDGRKLSDPISARITVKEVNDAPKAVDDSLGSKEFNSQGISISFDDLLQNDEKGPGDENYQTLTVKTVDNAVGGTVQIQDGKIIFNPSALGLASFKYMIEDNGRTDSKDDFKTATGTVQFTVVDTEKPVIVLNGDSVIFVELGSQYQEPGYSASDEVDRDLTSSTTVTGGVDTNHLGTYQLKFNVIDNSNNHAVEVTRTIHVVSSVLKTLSVSSGSLTPTFDPNEIAYNFNVPSNTTSIDISASTLDETAIATINSLAIGKSGTQTIPLQPGVNTISVVVTANGGLNRTYTLKITRELSTNANLSGLTLSSGTLSSIFDKNIHTYTVNVPNSVSSITVSPTVEDTGKATVSVNNQLSSTAVPLNVGDNKIQLVVTAEDGVTKRTYTISVNRAQASSSGGGGGYTPTPQPEPPKPEIITAPIEIGNKQGSNVSTATIKRTTDSNGAKKDEVELAPEKARETVEKLKEAGSDTARIVIPDSKDEVSEVNVSINKGSIEALQQGDINLEIYTDNARIAIPKESMSEINDDLYFRVLPIKEEQKKSEVKERAKQEEAVRKVAGSVNINVVGRPMTIETNMPNQPVDLILPLKGVTIPNEAKEREEFFNNLGVYIEHSDGEKVFIKGEVVPYKNGELGLKFTINKFSTFTILSMENGWEQKEPNFNDQFTGRTSEMELPVMADKVWNIKFNQAVKSSTVNNETVYMYDQDGGKVEIDIQLTNNTIKVSPKTYYKPDTKYYLYLSENIESSNGKRFGTSERYVFKTTPYSLETGKWQEKNNVSPNKEWAVTFNAIVKEALLTNEHIFVTDQHGSKVEVKVEVINSKSIKITPVKPYNNGETYYLFINGLTSDNEVSMKEQTWMKFTVVSE